MAILIKLFENKFGNTKTRGKWFAKTIKRGEAGISELAERVQENTTFKKGEVQGLIVELVDEMRQLLQDGQTVNLEGFGRFHLSVETNSVERPEDFRIQRDITAVKCKFVPAGHRVGKTGRIVQVLAKGAKVERLK